MMNAAVADLIQRTSIAAGVVHDLDSGGFSRAMEGVAEHEGTYTDGDVRLACVVVDELGPTEAVVRAYEYAPLDLVSELFRRFMDQCRDPLVSVDFERWFVQVDSPLYGLSPYDRGRFKGMVDCYVAYGPDVVPSEEEMAQAEEIARKAIEMWEGREQMRQELGLDDPMWSS